MSLLKGLLSLILALWVAALHAVPVSVNLATMPNQFAFAPSAWLLEDADKQLNLANIMSTAESLAWQPIAEAAPNFSFSKSAYWLWLRVENPHQSLQKRVLQIGMPLQDYIDLYQVDSRTKTVVRSFNTGDRRNFDSRPIKAKDFVFALDFEAGQTYDIVLRFDSHDGLYDPLPLTLWEQRAFHEATTESDLIYGAYYGALLSILIFNLFLYLSTRERVFLLYSLYLGAFFVWNFTFRGWAFMYWWPSWPNFNSQMAPIAGSLIFIFMIWFSTVYLQTKTLLPRAHKLMWLMAGLIAIGIGMAMFNLYAPVYQLMIPVYFLSLLVTLAVGVMLLFKGQRAAKFFVLAWGVLLVGAMIYFLRLAGLIPASPLTEYSLQIGSVLEFMLLAFGLADRINVLKSEKVALQQAALETEREATARLEDLVKRRTEQLETLNQRLQRQAITDGLTHVFNRRHFNRRLREFNQQQPFSLMLIDVDHFKPFNDLYGHQAGDEALIKVAQTLQALLEPFGGEVFRVGGEEFACLVRAEHQQLLTDLAHRLVSNVASLQIKHEKNVIPFVSISVGMLYVANAGQLSDDLIYAQADQLLYQAKEQGRNRVALTR